MSLFRNVATAAQCHCAELQLEHTKTGAVPLFILISGEVLCHCSELHLEQHYMQMFRIVPRAVL